MKRWIVWLAPVAMVLALTTSRVDAHANLLRAEPAPNSVHADAPDQVTLWFSEPLEPSASNIELLDANGAVISVTQASVDPTDPTVMRLALPALQPGVYTVSWRALSAVDGHLTRGVFPFVVGTAEAAPQAATAAGPAPGSFSEARPLDVLSRILTLIGGALIMGGFGVHLALWRPVRAAGRLAADAGDRRLRNVLMAGVGLGAAGIVLAVAAQVEASGSLTEAGAVIFRGRLGRDLAARGVLLVLLAFVAYRGATRSGQRPLVLGVGLSVLLLATTALRSHSAAVETERPAALLNDWLHLAAASLWVGGLAHVLLVGIPALRLAPTGHRPRLLAMLVRLFSALASASVAALVMTGLYSSWLHIGSLEALRTTAYGQTLLLKLVLILPMLALAALNLLHWRQHVAESEVAERGFVRTLGAESVLGLMILVVVGLLTGLGPARGVLEARQAEALRLRQAAGPLHATLTIRPPRPGPAHFEVRLVGPDGQPYEIARRVRLQFLPPDPSLGTGDATAEPAGDGRYVVEGAYLSIAGLWQVDLQVQRPDGYDVFTRFSLEVGNVIRPAAIDPRRTRLGDWLGWGLIVVGLTLVLSAFWLRRQREHVATAPLVLAIGIVLVATGGLRSVGPAILQEASAPTRNPLPATEASIARGEVLYQQYCQRCHGAAGRGDGPQVTQLPSRPADLHAHVPLHSDAELFTVITKGIPGTPMPAHAEQIASEDRWHIVNYLRVLVSSHSNH